MDACSRFVIEYSGKKEDTVIIQQALEEEFIEEYSHEGKSFVIDETYEIVYASDISEFAEKLVEANPKMDFSIIGTTDCNGNEFQNFEYKKQGSTLIERLTDWYEDEESRDEIYASETYIIGEKSDAEQTSCNLVEKTDDQIKAEWKYTILDDGTIRLDDYLGEDSCVVVPQAIEGRTVSELGEFSLSTCTDMFGTKLKKLPKGQKKVRQKINKVILPDTLRVIGKAAFQWSPIKSITIPDSVNLIDELAFENCKELEKISFGNGLKEIGARAFSGVHGVEEWYLPDGLEYIREDAFVYSSVYKIHIPPSVVEMGDCYIAALWDAEAVICGKSGSVAEQYAKERGLEFISE